MIIMFKTLWPNITENEINVLDEITEKTYRVVGIDGTESFRYLKPEDYPTFTTFSVVIDQMLEEYERQILINAKEKYGTSRKIAAVLKLDQSTVVRKMNKYGIK